MNAAVRQPGVDAWLEQLLRERFGHDLTLAMSAAGRVLSWPGRPGTVGLAMGRALFDTPSAALACTQWDPEPEGFQAPLKRPLPAPGLEAMPAPVVERTQSGHFIHYDILGLAHWMLGRLEEIDGAALDAHGRFPATASHAYRNGYLERPIVDEWFEILRQVMERTWPGLPRPGSGFTQKVSHDVDQPSRYAFGSARDLLRAVHGDLRDRRDAASLLRGPWLRLTSRRELRPSDPYNCFDWIMDVSERHGLTSAFYFICGRTDRRHDALYEPEHPAIRALLRRIHGRGHEIGLHPSYASYLSPDTIAAEARRLKSVCAEERIVQEEWGGRMHYLRWRTPETLHGWLRGGMTYDSTLSYADHAGFRAGTCFEYPALDPVAGRALGLRIRPLIAMECSVTGPGYMDLGLGEAAFEKFVELKDACRKVQGCFTLLWHNSRLASAAERELYQRVLSA